MFFSLCGNMSKILLNPRTERFRCQWLRTEQIRCWVFVREQNGCFLEFLRLREQIECCKINLKCLESESLTLIGSSGTIKSTVPTTPLNNAYQGGPSYVLGDFLWKLAMILLLNTRPHLKNKLKYSRTVDSSSPMKTMQFEYYNELIIIV